MVNGKFFVIDSHCHIYPHKIAERAVHGTDTFYSIDSVDDGTVETLLREGDEAGIDRFIVQSVATTPKQVSSIHKIIAAEVENSNGRFTGLGTLHPDSETLEDDVKEIMSLGLKGIKLHPDIQKFKIDDYRCLKIYELCEKYGLPILMHTGDKRYDYSNPNRLIPVLQIYSNLTIIGAHFGGWSIWLEAAEQLHGIKNFYVDCSSSFYALTDEEIIHLIRLYGADRVLFASDYPMWSPGVELKRLLSLGFSDEEYRMMFSENVQKIIKLND